MTLEELEERIKKIEEAIQQISLQPIVYNINVEKLVVKDPVLENLTFKLEKIDIKDLSGSLNLGNNFGIKTKTHRKSKTNEFEIEKINDDEVHKESSKERKHNGSKKNENTKKHKSEQTTEQASPVSEGNKNDTE